ncbi:HAD family hydrolase [Bacillus amyloliquefaciens]|uniref:HAD family hydrolase n=1 Tax=Bacillus amyloliquefaciens TaxID=1390 RepID=UPI002DB68CEF|nr:HAD family hydrolase [Bacillus amyloliquefaciens]MEC3838625.1 HAD family hydrolase [Bacillus amyloliquefaciens]
MRFVFDLDGTIVFKGKPVCKVISDALLGLQKDGHEVIFASARPIRDMLPVLDERFHTSYLIGGNGSLTSDGGRIVRVCSFTDQQKEKLLSLIAKYRAAYLIDSEWDYAYTGSPDHFLVKQIDPLKTAKKTAASELPSFVKVLITEADDLEAMAKELSVEDMVIHRHAGEGIIDISPPDIHKWSALEHLPSASKSFVAFGNDTNDVTLFCHASHAVMVGSHPELAKYADEVIALDGHEQKHIAQKINELSKQYAPADICL